MTLACFFAVSVLPAHSQDPTSSQDHRTDPDFTVQGEYTGDHRSMQVIAVGDGEFEIIVYDVALDRIAGSANPPRRLDGDEDTVADLADSLELERVERTPPSRGATPPPDAIVLFDGSQESLAQWNGGVLSEDGLLQQGTETKQSFRDYTLHLEFRTPWMPEASGQARGNSGVYHQGRYETQILDSFGLSGAANETGGIYGVKAPDFNACLPPMQWQTYDVDFTAARYQGNTKLSDARMTVRLNGVTVQNDVAVPNSTTAAKFREGPDDGPIVLQDHGNPVRFRNIWLVPRDAAREATRPIVPGFERFFAGREDPQGLGGELLISTLGCVSCHDGAEGVLPIKQGPVLSDVGRRVRPDALVDMIADPHKAKTGTTMPDPWMGLNTQQRHTAAASIASYLLLAGNPSDLTDRPAKPSAVKRGKRLYHRVGCVACHAAFDGTETPRATTVPLGQVDAKYTVDSLAQLIAQPHAVRQGARMPSLVGSMGDAYAIASYLTRNVTERASDAKFRRQIYKGQWERLPDFDALTPVAEDLVSDLQLKHDGDPANTAMVFESQIRIAAAGRYPFSIASDDGSRLIIGPHQIDNDGIHPVVTKQATFELAAGIYPVRIEWFNKGGGVGLEAHVEDPLLGRVPLREVITDGKEDSGPLLASEFRPDPNSVDSGRQLFQSTGCASCHEFQSTRPAARQIPGLADVRTDRGCLANSVSRPAVDFHLSPRQRLAIERAIELRKKQHSSAHSITDADLVHLTMAGLNCYACHRRGEFGGPEAARDASFQTTTAEMGWESRLPPPLDGVGDKLKSDYLTDLFAAGANERPYMLTRMPGFGAGHLDLLHQSLVRLDRQGSSDDAALSELADQVHVNDGRKLVGATGLSCIKCHSYNDVKGGGIGVIDLLAMPKRLRADWFNRYLQDPTKYRPGTRMPNSFPDGKSSFTSLYHGDPAKQVAAMWSYLAAGTSAKEPPGLRVGAILLAAAERPRIYRNFFEGVSGRGIAVGFPGEVNLIWDAERMGLNSVWKHEFIDAARHWTGRGQGRTTPAGDSIHTLEPWTPLAHGDSIDMTWPGESGRELGYRFGGYRLDEGGNPTFLYSIDDARVTDSIRPLGPGGFERQLTITRVSDDQSPGLIWRIAQAATIETAGDDLYQIGPLKLSVRGAECEIVSVDGRSELRARLPASNTVTVTQILQW
ncbi:family 16 glycoside hydrolase [Stieleria neptunia]|uniref:family 16 glycoside hydrolase n=1 Tax=Stieleria neptunia TaxID=2527979 RepID=UPI001E34AB4A|nr:family 16 glycoside hydrolase [Stieleria neptunia]